VYFGLDGVNARARAENFKMDELPQVMRELHAAGMKGFCAMNILLFDNELADVERRVRACAEAGVDALIVQDVGAVTLCRAVAPQLPVHASTQMTVTSAEGARFAADLGVKRVVAARELSIRELASVAAGLRSVESDVEVEAFVHGALCVSYSGQCLSSEAWGGRSANRGQCAQACRLPYGLLVDGQLRTVGDVKYVLSPQDLCGLDHVPALTEAGISCFKIEGRLKGPEYVAATVTAYRAAVDAAWAAATNSNDTASASLAGPTVQMRQHLRQVFARAQDAQHDGLSPGFLEGVNHQRLVRGRSPRHRGLLLGTVTGMTRSGGVRVALSGKSAAKRGAGVVFDAGTPEVKEQGGPIYDVLDPLTGDSIAAGGAEVSTGDVVLVFGNSDAVDTRAIKPGHLVWRTSDPAIEARLRAAATAPARKRAAHASVSGGALGQPLRVTLTSGGHTASAYTPAVLAPAVQKALTMQDVVREVGTLKGDGFQLLYDVDLSQLSLSVPPAWLPAGSIKAARRAAAQQLHESLDVHDRDKDLAKQPVLPDLMADARQAVQQGLDTSRGTCAPEVRVLCRTPQQVDAAIAVPWLPEISLDFLEVHGLQAAVQRVQAAGKRAIVATPRVLKPDEERLCAFYLRLRADGLLVRSIGMLQSLTALGGPGAVVNLPGTSTGGDVTIPPLLGDFSLNGTNTLSVAHFLTSGLSRFTPAHDLNAEQLCALASSVGPAAASQLEVVIHQHLPVFHTEHCLFARHLSDGTSFKDCGHPCERHTLHVRAPDGGGDHRILADAGCRNTVFSAAPQSGAQHVAQLAAVGVGGLRVELLDDPPEQVAPLLAAYKALVEGSKTAAAVMSWLGQRVDSRGVRAGVTLGSLEVKSEISRSAMKPTAAALQKKSSQGKTSQRR